MLYCQVLTLNLQYYNASTLAFKRSIVESCKSMLLFCGIVDVLSGSSVNESITEAYVALGVRCWGVLCLGHFLVRLVRLMYVCVCVCVQSESSLLKDRRSSSAGLTAASSDMVLLRDVASLKERGRVIVTISHFMLQSFFVFTFF